MKPYYTSSDSRIVIYHGDCLDIDDTFPTCDLIVMDPPYGKNYKSNRASNFDAIIGDESQAVALLGLGVCLKRLKHYRHLYVFGPFDLSALPISGITELVWDKVNIGMGNLSLPWGPQHERITFGVYVPSKAGRKRGDGRLAARLRKGSVLRSLRPNSKRAKFHPSEKPVDILRMMIESSSMLDEMVLDPFMGSGSVLIAAAMEGRKAIGIEISEEYCEIAAKRIEAEVKPT